MNDIDRSGHECWLVGGCVRDHIMGRTPNDYDIASSMPAPKVKSILCGYKVLETGLKFGTVTVMAGEYPVEITAFRTETGYSDHRRPSEVRFDADIGADLMRRDFTMNAIAYSPARGFRDDYGGLEDIENGIIRCVGDPYRRFEEDALRILRALRFSSVFGFEIHAETADAADKCKTGLRHISAERIWAEISLFLRGDNAPQVFRDNFEVFTEIFCGIADPHVLIGSPCDPILRLALICRDCGKDFERQRLRCDKNTSRAVCELLKYENLKTEDKLFLPARQQMRLAYFDKGFGSEAIGADGYPIIYPSALTISGDDIIELGAEPGPDIKRIIGKCMIGIVRGEVSNEPESLRTFAKSIIK